MEAIHIKNVTRVEVGNNYKGEDLVFLSTEDFNNLKKENEKMKKQLEASHNYIKVMLFGV